MEFVGDRRDCEVHVNSIWLARTELQARQIMANRRGAKVERAFKRLRAHSIAEYAKLSLIEGEGIQGLRMLGK